MEDRIREDFGRKMNDINKTLRCWENNINLALKNGKGKYGKFTFVGDLFDYKKIIKLIRQKELKRAFYIYYNLDTDSQEGVPMRIIEYISN